MKVRAFGFSRGWQRSDGFEPVPFKTIKIKSLFSVGATALLLTLPLPRQALAQDSTPSSQASQNRAAPGLHPHLPSRLVCSFQTAIAPFQEAHAEWTQSAENPSLYRLHSVRGDALFALYRSTELLWEVRVRQDAHRLRFVQRASTSIPLPCETRASCRPRFRESLWEATSHLSAVATLRGDAPNHWAGTLDAIEESWTTVRSTTQDPFAFLRRSSDRVRKEEVNVSVACQRISE